MILHSNHRGFDIERTVGIAQTQYVCKLKRRRTAEKNFARSAKFDDGTLGEIARARIHFAATADGKLNRNAYRRSVGEKASQSSYCAGDLRRASRGCGCMCQTMKTRCPDPFST